MKKVEATIPALLLEDVKERLCLIGVRGMTIVPVRVFGGERAVAAQATAWTGPRRTHVRLYVVVVDDMVETVANAIMVVARRGDGHDGEILVTPVEEVFRIRTRERGEDAL